MQFGSNSLQHNNEFMYMKQIYVYALAHTVNEDKKKCLVFSQSMLTNSHNFLWSLFFHIFLDLIFIVLFKYLVIGVKVLFVKCIKLYSMCIVFLEILFINFIFLISVFRFIFYFICVDYIKINISCLLNDLVQRLCL